MNPDSRSFFDELKMGCMFILQQSELASPLPLEHTAVDGQIIGAIASVKVRQWFGNPFDYPIELEYLFPLPHEAAVVDYEIQIGERKIQANLKEVKAARREYTEAVEAGQRASLLEQRRPNLFAIKIGNVQPGETIITTLEYEDRLEYSDDSYEFIFPMGITPRYHKPEVSPDDAQTVNAPIAGKDEKISAVELHLSVDAGIAVEEPVSNTHTINLERQSAQKFDVSLTGDNIPNKDFVLRYPVAGDTIRTAIQGSKDEAVETLVLSLQPPQLDLSQDPEPREFIFVLDRSGSMSGEPIVQARNALRACLRAMGNGDTFRIQIFSDRLEWFRDEALAVNQENVDVADKWIESIEARGGTDIEKAVEAALTIPEDAERQRYVVFLTDGAVYGDEQAIRQISDQRGNARIFTFGIGPSVNRYVLDKMAQMGRGVAEFLSVNDDIETAITRFQDRVSYPALMDIQLKWNHAEAWDTYPEILPDLYIGQPLEIVTRLRRQDKNAQVKITGRAGGQEQTFTVDIPPFDESNPVIQRLWARAHIESLLDEDRRSRINESRRERIISLGLSYRLMTPYTAFVAVDSETTENDKEAKTVQVSVPLPEGLELEGFGRTGEPDWLSAAAFSADTGVSHIVSPRPRSGGSLLGRIDRGPARKQARRSAGSQRLFSHRRPVDEEETKSFAAFKEKPEPAPEPVAEIDAMTIDDDTPAQADHQKETIDVRWLARNQNINGSWQDDVELTAVALLVFIRSGHTMRKGSYRRHVSKATKWLANQFQATTGFDQWMIWRALYELEQQDENTALIVDLRSQQSEPVTELEKAAAMLDEVSAPEKIESLDDLRLAVLLHAENILLNWSDTDLVAQVWQAVYTIE